jgi:hypothetical protein
MRTEASTLKPPEPCQVSMPEASCSLRRPVATEVAKDASLEDRLHLADVLGGQLVGLVELDLAAAVLAETPSSTTRWQCGWAMREEPKR